MQNMCVKEYGIMVHSVSRQVVCTRTVPAFIVNTTCPETLFTIIPHSFIHICSAYSNLQLASQFFYMMCKA
jgi:hypothetical protein